jgi:protein ImuB
MHWIAIQPASKPPDVLVANSHVLTDGHTALRDANAAAQAHSPTEANALVDVDTALAWWALRFTPLVARVEEALVLEVSGSERLFGGRAALMQQLFESGPPSLALDYAQGDTSLLALARLWAQAPDAPIDALPLHSLASARAHLPTLMRLGCSNWGQLRALPRGGLARRFGAGLVDALDQAYGARPELYPWLTLPEVFDAPLELSAAVESASAMLFGARRLLAQLLVWLRARQRGVLVLELLWELDARRSNALHVDAHHQGGAQGRMELRTAQATQDMTHLQRLLAEQLAQVTLPAPVLYLRLRTLQTQDLGGESFSLLPEDQRKGDSLHLMLERLGARLGREHILCVQPQTQHAPEDMQTWQTWKAGRTDRAGKAQTGKRVQDLGAMQSADAALMPTWLLAMPQPLSVKQHCPQYHGALTLLAGPHRLETGWLDGEVALRDYFVARSAYAGLVWIYRERLPTAQPVNLPAQSDADLRWYLHGLFA